jgi:hypothetical protein
VPETFTPKTWADGSGGGTPITAAELNRMETGLESMDDRVAAIEAIGPTANATDAALRDRSTHTGTQAAATISDFTETAQDAAAGLLTAGVHTGLTATYVDASNRVDLAVTSGGSGYATVQDEGTARTARATLNFVGAGVTVTDDATNSRTVVTIPGGGSATGVLPVINVKTDHGAVGDGTTSDRAALQAAAAAVPATGGILFLPPGTYSTDRCIDIKSNTTVMGAGMGVSIIRGRSGLGGQAGTNGGYTLLGQASGATQNITVRDLTVDGNYAATGITSGSALRLIASVVDFRGINRMTFENVEVKNGWFWHLTTWNSTDVTVRGCRVTGPGTSGTYNQLDGIHMTGVTRCKIVDCFVDTGVGTDGDDGIAIHQFPGDPGCTDVEIIGNTVRGGFNGCGIDLANGDGTIKGVTITGNTIRDCAGVGIITNWFSAFTGTTQDVTIVGNTIRDCAVGSIWIGDDTGNSAPHKNIVVTNNLCTRSVALPVRSSTANSSNVNIANNYVGT